MSLVPIQFTVRNKGGALGGQTIEHLVAEFDWEVFKNTPNSEEFVRKAYYAAAKKFIRELHEGRNQTEEHHLQSMENLIARSLSFTQQEIKDWCEERDWSIVTFKGDREKALGFLKEQLPRLASSENDFPDRQRHRAAEIVAEVADSKSDPVANYLFVKLTQGQKNDDLANL